MTAIIESPSLVHSGEMTFAPWIHQETIKARVAEMAGHLAASFNGQKIRVLPVLNGGRPFSGLLLREMAKLDHGPTEVTIDAIQVKSYQGTDSRNLTWRRYPRLVAQPDVHDVILDDIADSARTLNALGAYMQSQDAASLTTAVLLDRPSARAYGIDYQPDLVGFQIDNPDAWAIGFGLDLDEQYRELPDIYGKIGPNGELPPPYSIPPLPDRHFGSLM